MLLLIIIFMVFTLILTIAAYGIRNNFLLLYNIWWYFFMILSSINIVDNFKVNDDIYIICIISITVFNFIYFFTCYFNQTPQKLPKLQTNFNKSFLVFNFIFLVITIFFLIKMYGLIGGTFVNYWQVRSFYWGVPILGSTVNLFPSPIIAIIYHVLTFFLGVYFLYSLYVMAAFNRKSYMYLSIFNMMLYSTLSAGRNLLIMNFVILFIYMVRMGLLNKLKYPIIILLLLIVTLSSIRNGDSGFETFLYSIYSYFTGVFNFFGYWYENNNSDLFYGGVILSQIFSGVISVINIVGADISSPHLEVTTELQQFIEISNNNPFYNYYNALPSWLYFSIRDFGLLGVVIYPLIYSVIYLSFIRKLDFNIPEHKLIITYLEVFLIWSFFKPLVFDFSSLSMLLVFYCILKFGHKKIKII